MNLTVTEAAIIDLQRQKEASMARAKNFDPTAQTREPNDINLTPGAVDALSRPVRIEIDFSDPIRVRSQLAILAGAIVDAQVITQQHEIGINRQRMRLRGVIKEAADAIAMFNGKTPAGRQRRGV